MTAQRWFISNFFNLGMIVQLFFVILIAVSSFLQGLGDDGIAEDENPLDPIRGDLRHESSILSFDLNGASSSCSLSSKVKAGK